MNKRKIFAGVTSFMILALTCFCVLTSPFDKEGDVKDQASSSVVSITPSPMPTMVPTNLVKLDDIGEPLPPKPLIIIPSGGQEIGSNGAISVQFDQQMDSNATSSAWNLINHSGQVVEGQIEWPRGDTIQFTPKNPLNSGEIYKVRISTKAASGNKVQLSEAIHFEVRVADDLIVSQVFPTNGAENIENDSVITVIFNRPVVPVTAIENQVDLVQPLRLSPEIDGWGEWLNSSVYLFHPDPALKSATLYSVRVMNGLEDLIGTQLQKSFEWKFTTAAPSISSFAIASPVHILNPKDNFENVHLNSTFSVQFNQAMNKSSVSEELSLYSLHGETVPFQYEWPSDNQVIITPTQSLTLDTDYSLLLSENARSDTGGTLNSGLRWNFRTNPYPGIQSTYPENGSIQDRFSNRFSIYFRSPMDLETIEERLLISPSPEIKPTWYYDAWGNRADFYGLEPSTNYSIFISPGIDDIYGNPITEDFEFSFRTGDLRSAAYLDLPYAPSIYRMGGAMKFYVSYVNVDSVDVDLFEIPPSYFSGFINGTYNRWEFVPPDDWWSNGWYLENNNGVNDVVRRGFRLEDTLGKSLKPGFYFLTIDSPQVESYGRYLDTRLLVVSETNLTFKTTLTEGLVWITDLDTGDPIPDVSLKIFDDEFKEIGAGATNENGLLYLELPVPDEVYQSRFAMSDTGESFGFASSDWGSGVSPYEFGIWSDYYTLPGQPMTYVYTDRPLYRPGQTVHFKGILRGNDDLNYSLLPWNEVIVEIHSYNEMVNTEKLKLSPFGTFNGQIILDDNAALGYYSILVKEPLNENEVGGVGFSVAEYRKPEFQITTSVESKDYLAGSDIKIDIQAEYYAGGMVAGADVEWVLKADDFAFRPGGELNRYSFEDRDRELNLFEDFNRGNSSRVIANGKGVTDKNGMLILSLLADLSEANISQRLTFEATVTDLAGISVSGQTEVVAHRAAFYPGIMSSHYVGKVNEEQGFEIVVVDWNGDSAAGARVDVEIVERRWYSVQEQDEQGFVHWVTSVEEILVAQYQNQTMDSRGRSKVTFVPEKGGIYKAKVLVQDPDGNKAGSAAYIWISSNDFISWRQTDDRRIELVSDKDKYQAGDIAEILIASPLAGDNYALVTVERGHIRETDVIRLASNSAVYRLPISEDMAPNIYFSVLIIQGSDVGGKPDFRMGIIQLNVDTGDQEIQISIMPDRNQAGPGDEVTYKVRTTDVSGQPVQAEVSFALADKAALALTQPNTLPILDYFYSQRSLSVRTAVPIVLSIEHYISTLEDRLTEGEGMGSGGGKGADVYGVIDVRGEFRDTAFWQANVVTDEYGEATLTVQLPDNLTTWLLDTRAVTVNTLVGDGENEIQSTKPLLVRPQTPRFVVEGDQLTVGAAVHNNSAENLDVKVILDATGLTLESPASQVVSVNAGNQIYLTWDVLVDYDVDRVDMTFTAKGGPYIDASKPTMGTLEDQGIPVYKYEVPETVGTSGMLSDGGSHTEGVVIPSQWNVTQGEFSVRLSPSMAASMVEGLEYLETYPYECVEQTISKFLPNILTTRVMGNEGISDPALEENLSDRVNKATQRLSNWQRPDGGWGWWPEAQRSDPLTTAYVVLGLVEARDSGFPVGSNVLTRGVNYLKANLKSLGSLDKPFLLNRQAFMLYVLARAEQPQVSLTVVMYDSRQSLSVYAKAYLAETLWMIDSQDPRLGTLVSDLVNSAVVSSTGIHWEENWRDYWNWNTDTRTTAIVLATLLRIDPENKIIPNGIRWLMLTRELNHWGTTQNTTWSLMTLIRWLEYSDELDANYDWAVGLNGERVGDGSADVSNYQDDVQFTIDVEDLMLDVVNRLTIARDEGTGNLYYTAHLNIALPVDQIEPVDSGIIISREYFDPSMSEMGAPITKTEQGKILVARLAIVVPNDVHYIIVDDPLPAGLEAVDPTLETSPDITAPDTLNYEALLKHGWGRWAFDHIELRDERVVLSADYLPAGTYVYTYLVRASTLGTFHVIPPTAQEFYFPEVYGRGAGTQFVINP